MNKKRGDISIMILTLFVIILLIIMFAIFLLQVQINSTILYIKNDLFYILQNSFMLIDNDKLAYSDYEIDIEELKTKVIYILGLNYPNYIFEINDIGYDYSKKTVFLDMNLNLDPIVLKDLIGSIDLQIQDEVKIKLMEVTN